MPKSHCCIVVNLVAFVCVPSDFKSPVSVVTASQAPCRAAHRSAVRRASSRTLTCSQTGFSIEAGMRSHLLSLFETSTLRAPWPNPETVCRTRRQNCKTESVRAPSVGQELGQKVFRLGPSSLSHDCSSIQQNRHARALDHPAGCSDSCYKLCKTGGPSSDGKLGVDLLPAPGLAGRNRDNCGLSASTLGLISTEALQLQTTWMARSTTALGFSNLL